MSTPFEGEEPDPDVESRQDFVVVGLQLGDRFRSRRHAIDPLAAPVDVVPQLPQILREVIDDFRRDE